MQVFRYIFLEFQSKFSDGMSVIKDLSGTLYPQDIVWKEWRAESIKITMARGRKILKSVLEFVLEEKKFKTGLCEIGYLICF